MSKSSAIVVRIPANAGCPRLDDLAVEDDGPAVIEACRSLLGSHRPVPSIE
jgi:hypothetical protein